MGSPATLPLSTFFNVSVVITPTAPPGPSFNVGLIVGSSTVIPASQRVRTYQSTSQMLTDGFLTNSPEYMAAQIYFGQTPAPSQVQVGRQDLTSIATVIATTGQLGTGYAVNDILGITQSGGSGGQVKVTALGASNAIGFASTTATASSGSTSLTVALGTGIQVGMSVAAVGVANGATVTAVAGTTITISIPTTAALSATAITFSGIVLISAGTGYSAANGLTTTGGTGTGAEVSITAIGDTPLQAVAACRVASVSWYAAMFVGTASGAGIDVDLESIAAFIEGANPRSTFFCSTGESNVINGITPNLMSVLKAAAYRRTLCVYSTTQGGSFPNNIYAAAQWMGQAMGRNTGNPGSYFTLAYKEAQGVGTEPLTQTQLSTIAGTADRTTVGFNGNVFASFGNSYNLLFLGTMSGGIFFDTTMFLDMLVADIQNSGVAFLVEQNAIPLTEAGLNAMKNVVAGACQRSQALGFIAPSGTWNLAQIGTGNGAINTGAPLPNGYAVYASPISTLTTAQRTSRIFPPITAAIILAGAGQSFSVTVDVQQ